jgi:DNA-binding response OmpR family regulator
MIQKKHNPKHHGNKSQETSVPKRRLLRVLVAEDDDEMRKLLLETLRTEGYEVVECRDGADFLMQLQAFIVNTRSMDFDVIVSDIVMPGLTGLEILEDLHECKGFPPMILITAFGDKGIRARAIKSGAAAIIDKPFEIVDLLARIREIVSSQSNEKGKENAVVE